MAKVAKRVAIATQNSGKSSGKHQWQKVRTYLSTYLAFGLWLAFQESGERKAAIVTYLTREARDARRFKSDQGLV